MTANNSSTQSLQYSAFISSTTFSHFFLSYSSILFLHFLTHAFSSFIAQTLTHSLSSSHHPRNKSLTTPCTVQSWTYQDYEKVPEESLWSAPRLKPHCSPHSCERHQVRGVTRASHSPAYTLALYCLPFLLFSLEQGCQPPRIQRYIHKLPLCFLCHIIRRWFALKEQGMTTPMKLSFCKEL